MLPKHARYQAAPLPDNTKIRWGDRELGTYPLRFLSLISLSLWHFFCASVSVLTPTG